MNYKNCFWIMALTAMFAYAHAEHQESYAYFGPAICSLTSDVPQLMAMAHDKGLSVPRLAALQELIAQGYTTAPTVIVKAALEEAALCIMCCKDTQPCDELVRIADALEIYDHALQSGAAEVDITDSESLPVKGTKKFDNAIIRQQLSSGRLYVGGDTIINHNLTVNNDEIINGNLIVEGSTIFSGTVIFNGAVAGNTNLGTCTSTNNIAGTTNINTNCAAATNVGTGTGRVTIGNATGNIFFPTNLTGSAFGDEFLVINPANGQVRLDVGGDLPGAIVNGGQPGPLTIGTTNATGLSLVTSGSNTSRLAISQTGGVNIAMPSNTAEVGLTITGTTAGALRLIGNPATISGDNALFIDPVTHVVKEGPAAGGVQITNYKASVLSAGDQTILGGGPGNILTLAFTNELYDPNNNFSTDTYTVPTNGVYLLDLSLILTKTPTAAGGTMEYNVSIYIDGVAAANNTNLNNMLYLSGSTSTYEMSRQLSLNAGQLVTVVVQNNMTDDLVIQTNSEFSVHILSANP